MGQESHGKTAHHAMLNAGIVGSAVSARDAAGVASVAGTQSVAANAVTSMEMAMPMSRATAAPMRRRRMHAVRVARNLAEMGEAKVEGKVEAKAALKVEAKVALRAALKLGTSAGQTAARVSMTQCKRVLPPTR